MTDMQSYSLERQQARALKTSAATSTHIDHCFKKKVFVTVGIVELTYLLPDVSAIGSPSTNPVCDKVPSHIPGRVRPVCETAKIPAFLNENEAESAHHSKPREP